ncbi:unnamed protein product [Owenia fusiformis]|uniref:Uncharacterized protein n=1 Tax=Owenia fusiformis TaxID=6347 RepID=A0A8S4NN39_OWEFU|nr:unnamed protein product [Owenia fusiformis]
MTTENNRPNMSADDNERHAKKKADVESSKNETNELNDDSNENTKSVDQTPVNARANDNESNRNENQVNTQADEILEDEDEKQLSSDTEHDDTHNVQKNSKNNSNNYDNNDELSTKNDETKSKSNSKSESNSKEYKTAENKSNNENDHGDTKQSSKNNRRKKSSKSGRPIQDQKRPGELSGSPYASMQSLASGDARPKSSSSKRQRKKQSMSSQSGQNNDSARTREDDHENQSDMNVKPTRIRPKTKGRKPRDKSHKENRIVDEESIDDNQSNNSGGSRNDNDEPRSKSSRRHGQGRRERAKSAPAGGVRTKQPTTRILQLSKHKDSKSVWLTRFGESIMWGTQDMLWDISDAAMAADPTGRVMDLSIPKKNFQTGNKVNRPEFVYSCGRSSEIWDVSPLAKKAECSDRVGFLANPKQAPAAYKEKEGRPSYLYSSGRVSPLWKVHPAAKSCGERERTMGLARPKMPHQSFTGAKPIATIIPRPALSARCTDRLETLAESKNRSEGPFREPMWPVSDRAKTAQPSNRSLELAKPKSLAEGYIPERGVEWPVTRGAKKAIASARTTALSEPIVRASMDHVQFDPDAFLVSPLALKARCAPRIEELSQPIQR